MPNNTMNPADLDRAPAQMVGGMRVKQPDAHRVHLREEEAKDDNVMSGEEAEERDLTHEEQKYMEEQERLRIRELQERQAQDMHAHAASRQHDISKNAGSNVKQQFIPPTQPRSMNH